MGSERHANFAKQFPFRRLEIAKRSRVVNNTRRIRVDPTDPKFFYVRDHLSLLYHRRIATHRWSIVLTTGCASTAGTCMRSSFSVLSVLVHYFPGFYHHHTRVTRSSSARFFPSST